MKEKMEKIDSLLESCQPAEAFRFCAGTLISDESLSPKEQEMLALQQIRCVINTIKLESLYGDTDEETYVIYPSEYGKEDMERLEKYIFKLIKYLNPKDQEKIQNMYLQVCAFANDWFDHFMPYYVESIVDQQTNYKNTLHFQGHICLHYYIHVSFDKLAKMACIKNVEFLNLFKKPYRRYAEKLYSQCCDTIGKIIELAIDFPHFTLDDATQAAQLNLLAEFLCSRAIDRMEECDSCDAQKVIAWKKNKINLLVDRLNMIAVANGQRQSFYYEQTERDEIITDIRNIDSAPEYYREGFSTMRGGCYVATAVYGSYDCPEVWVLRRYRDQQLAKTWYGRAFIRVYYAISPTLVKWFGKCQWFKKLFEPTLEKMVRQLRLSGIDSTPYEDIDWNNRK